MHERALLAISTVLLVACDGETCPLASAGGSVVAVDIVADGEVTAALMSDGSGFCWGDDHGGECGFGIAGYASTPQPMKVISCLSQVSLQTYGMSAGLSPDGVVKVWGMEDALRRAGDGPGSSDYMRRAGVVGVPRSVRTASGDGYMMAITEDHAVYWWGSVAYAWSEGMIQDWFRADFPERLPVNEPCSSIATGHHASCLLDLSGGVWCFGANHFGQLGTPPSSVGQLEPVSIPLPGAAAEIAAQDGTFCAMLLSREAYCWGLPPGFGSVTDWVPPTKIDGMEGVGLAVGGGHMCVLDDDGVATCTGDAGAFGLDEGIDDPPLPPFQWMPDLRFRKLALGLARTCGLTTDGRVYCAGMYAGLGPHGPREGFVDIEGALREREAEEAAK